ncbi:MAG TPA: hypothetical protein DDZ81_07270 [Acetobacteraceae bacterium]|nr:hypothetical protein [Acetobacteraceae bacterium]
MAVQALRDVWGGQLAPRLSALSDLDPHHKTVLMAGVMAGIHLRPASQRKIVLVLSAMRHFATALAARGARSGPGRRRF